MHWAGILDIGAVVRLLRGTPNARNQHDWLAKPSGGDTIRDYWATPDTDGQHAYLNRIKMQVKVCNSEKPLLNAFAVPVPPGAEQMWPEAG
jgi:hypothetical protein